MIKWKKKIMKNSKIKPMIKKDALGTYEIHPAFGSIVVSHPRGGGIAPLFKSHVHNPSCIQISIYNATNRIDYMEETIHPCGKPIATIEMTESQWARFVSSMGIGEGTPCTLKYTEKNGVIADIDGDTTKEKVNTKIKEDIDKFKTIISEFSELLEKKLIEKKITKKIYEELKNKYNAIYRQLYQNIPFLQTQMEELHEKIAESSKIEIEAYANNLFKTIGLEKLRDSFNSSIECKVPENIQMIECDSEIVEEEPKVILENLKLDGKEKEIEYGC